MRPVGSGGRPVTAPETSEDARRFGREVLVGQRVRLRAVEEDDLVRLAGWSSDPEWQPLQRVRVQPRPSGPMVDDLRQRSRNEDRADLLLLAVERREDGALAGYVQLRETATQHLSATLVIMLGPEMTGRGLGSDAVRVALRYAFAVMGLNRVQLLSLSYNDRALRAYQRAGFVEEGRWREAVYIDGGYADQVMMSVLRREWDQDRAPTS